MWRVPARARSRVLSVIGVTPMIRAILFKDRENVNVNTQLYIFIFIEPTSIPEDTLLKLNFFLFTIKWHYSVKFNLHLRYRYTYYFLHRDYLII